MIRKVRGRLNENISYKIVALFVTLVLWMTMLSRKDTVMTKEIPLQFLLGPRYAIANEVRRQVQVKVSGPRMALKKFSQTDEVFTVDMAGIKEGRQRIRLTQDGLNLPLGVKVLAIEPEEIVTYVRKVEERQQGD